MIKNMYVYILNFWGIKRFWMSWLVTVRMNKAKVCGSPGDLAR